MIMNETEILKVIHDTEQDEPFLAKYAFPIVFEKYKVIESPTSLGRFLMKIEKGYNPEYKVTCDKVINGTKMWRVKKRDLLDNMFIEVMSESISSQCLLTEQESKKLLQQIIEMSNEGFNIEIGVKK